MSERAAINDWADLRQRLMDAEDKLRQMANEAWSDPDNSAERSRLLAKKEGVSLALSYMREYPTHRLAIGRSCSPEADRTEPNNSGSGVR